ncbi:MAG: DUF3810 domain-containing protein [Wujia sp.]
MYKRFLIIFAVIIVALNCAAWMIPGLCDWYTLYITPIWYNLMGRFSNLFRFSVGEIMLILGISLIITAILLGILYIVFRKKHGCKKFCRVFYRIFFMICMAVCLIMTLNCTMLYHCTPLDPNEKVLYREYSIEELEKTRNYIVEMCNKYSQEMERDENGYLVYQGDMQEAARQALHGIADYYPKLSGYYPDVKNMFFSDLMSQAYMAGYYFPFSMEANCNSKMYISNYPAVYCHELAHLHGYIYEDEANFLAFLACVESEDDFFVYCGYLSVLNYIDNAYWRSIDEDIARYISQPQINQLVDTDNVFLLEETWDEVESEAVLATDTVESLSNDFTETSLKMNGVKQGMASYGEVVGLLLQYYDGVLY